MQFARIGLYAPTCGFYLRQILLKNVIFLWYAFIPEAVGLNPVGGQSYKVKRQVLKYLVSKKWQKNPYLQPT